VYAAPAKGLAGEPDGAVWIAAQLLDASGNLTIQRKFTDERI
jgi:hypothetical protein